VLRSIGDVGRFEIELYSGRHPGKAPPQEHLAQLENRVDSRPLGQFLADLILEPGVGVDQEEFARQLTDSRLIAQAIGGRLHTAEKLRELIRAPPSTKVGRAACFELSYYFPSQYGCLMKLLADPAESDESRKHLTEYLAKRRAQDTVLEEELVDPARLGFPNWMVEPDSMRAEWEELVIMVGGDGERIPILACAALRRYFPYEIPVECEGREK
jgi:hypothetical protein